MYARARQDLLDKFPISIDIHGEVSVTGWPFACVKAGQRCRCWPGDRQHAGSEECDSGGAAAARWTLEKSSPSTSYFNARSSLTKKKTKLPPSSLPPSLLPSFLLFSGMNALRALRPPHFSQVVARPSAAAGLRSGVH